MSDNVLTFPSQGAPEMPRIADTLRMIADAIDAGQVGTAQAFVLFSLATDGSGEADIGIRGFKDDAAAARYFSRWFEQSGGFA